MVGVTVTVGVCVAAGGGVSVGVGVLVGIGVKVACSVGVLVGWGVFVGSGVLVDVGIVVGVCVGVLVGMIRITGATGCGPAAGDGSNTPAPPVTIHQMAPPPIMPATAVATTVFNRPSPPLIR